MSTAKPSSSQARGGLAPAAVMACAVGLLALPSAVLAFSSRLDVAPPDTVGNGGMGAFAPGSVDPRLASALAAHPAGKGPLFRFTPAGIAARPDRSVTVAVRVDSETARSIIVRAPNAPRLAANTVPMRITPTAYSLGLSHGYLGFAPGTQNFVLPGDTHKPELPDLSGFSLSDASSHAAPSRLVPHIQLGERDRAGRAPGTLEGSGEQTVDLGGSYRLTHNIDVLAGVRYSQDRDRMKPLTDGKQDDQAVFVGTQFRF